MLVDFHGTTEKRDGPLIVCAHNCEKITAIRCTSNAFKNMEPLRKEIAAWQAKTDRVPY